MFEDLNQLRFKLLQLDVSLLDFLIEARKAELRRIQFDCTDSELIFRLDAQINILDQFKLYPAEKIKSIEDKLADNPE